MFSDQSNLNEAKSDPLRSANVSVIGTVLDQRYKILSLIAQGGMGAVYKASHLQMDQTVAVKIMSSTISGITLKRFQQEAKLLSLLDHPNIVRVNAFGVTADGRPYLAMEYLTGTTLAELLEHELLPMSRALELFRQICDGLGCAHEQGIVHRDLKPSNILVAKCDGSEDQLKVVDFGIARLVLADGREPQRLTQTGQLIGSPYYMSPEQLTGKPLDGRSDIYAMGCLMYECLAGCPPFAGQTPMETMLQHLNNEPAPLQKKGTAALQRIIFKCLQKDPDQRFASMVQLREALQSINLPVDTAVVPALLRGLSPQHFSSLIAAVLLGTLICSAVFMWIQNKSMDSYERAVKVMESDRQTKPGEKVNFLRDFGDRCRANGQWTGAQKAYSRAEGVLNVHRLAESKLMGDIKLRQGIIAYAHRDFDTAEKLMRRALALQDTNAQEGKQCFSAEAACWLADTLSTPEVGNYLEAEQLYARVEPIYERRTEVLYRQVLAQMMTKHGNALMSLKKIPQAEQKLRQAKIEADKVFPEGAAERQRVRQLLVQCLELQGKHREVRKILDSK